jgi:hypothetical protein
MPAFLRTGAQPGGHGGLPLGPGWAGMGRVARCAADRAPEGGAVPGLLHRLGRDL